nr:uncharacterized protein CTRU02_01359 [Colletotrichum truncatum]KAF6799680.1 hypothetical protein CTRU02_01359 [Colletotrichum truncatum]
MHLIAFLQRDASRLTRKFCFFLIFCYPPTLIRRYLAGEEHHWNSSRYHSLASDVAVRDQSASHVESCEKGGRRFISLLGETDRHYTGFQAFAFSTAQHSTGQAGSVKQEAGPSVLPQTIGAHSSRRQV